MLSFFAHVFCFASGYVIVHKPGNIMIGKSPRSNNVCFAETKYVISNFFSPNKNQMLILHARYSSIVIFLHMFSNLCLTMLSCTNHKVPRSASRLGPTTSVCSAENKYAIFWKCFRLLNTHVATLFLSLSNRCVTIVHLYAWQVGSDHTNLQCINIASVFISVFCQPCIRRCGMVWDGWQETQECNAMQVI